MRIGKRTICIVIVLMTGANVANMAQSVQTLQNAQEVNVIETAIAQRLSTSPAENLVKNQLAEDRMALEGAAPQVISAFQTAGHPQRDAVAGLAWTWYLLRVGENPTPMTSGLSLNMIQMKAAILGKLIVNSEPNGATITVDKVIWPDPTNREGFAEVGARRVRVTMSGLQPAEQVCQVSRNRAVTFAAKLGKQGSRAECK